MTPRALVALCCALLLLMTACTGDDGDTGEAGSDAAPTASPDSTAPPKPPRRPRVGDCHDLSWEEALSPVTPTETRVACKRRHTGVTFRVGRVPRNRAGKQLPVDSVRVQRQVARACPDALPGFLGASQDEVRRSVLRAVWFTPSLAEAQSGAKWFRCDVVATGRVSRLAQLPARMRGALADDALRERFALCATGEPGASFTRVPCSVAHTWRAVTTVDVEGDAYPGRRAVEDAMASACGDAATEAASNPLDVRWSQEAPTRRQWRAGQRFGYCWVPA
ncbi:septum formation family protein [Nocardioides sp. Y6]|uniref:Septum formation family protein n=1 Tax=Nocardioides malaquae TaxID=2773426 RepID=A0ABR9RQ46_9ACTN|nr:septum formation family protein [Nocardioides malaquae]MBE7323697.1 septum formation family protein [Nocardioides malaquae]